MVIFSHKSKSITSLFPPATEPSGSASTSDAQQPKKRQREDLEQVISPPLITIQDTANLQQNQAVSMLSPPDQSQAKRLAVRLDRLHNKKAR